MTLAPNVTQKLQSDQNNAVLDSKVDYCLLNETKEIIKTLGADVKNFQQQKTKKSILQIFLPQRTTNLAGKNNAAGNSASKSAAKTGSDDFTRL